VRANLCAVGILICPGVDVPSARTAGLSHDRRGPRPALSPSPRPLGRRSAMAVEVSVGYVRWVGVWARAWEGRAARGAEWDGMKWKERGAEWADGRLEREGDGRLWGFGTNQARR
jgi:hypothetical protein